MNLPGYEFLSAPLWLINILHVVTLTLHLTAMNFLVGGLITLLLGPIDDRWTNPAVQKYVKWLPTAMGATITFGVAPLLFIQLVYPEQVYSASIVSGWFWLLIIPVVIIAYYCLYGASFGKRTEGAARFLWPALIGFLYVSLVYSSVFSLAEKTGLGYEVYAANQSGLVLNPDVGGYIWRWLHMVFGAVTVGGFFVGWVGKDNDDVYQAGKRFFLWGMVVAAVLGTVYLLTFGDYLRPFMKSPGIWALTVGIILSIGSLHFYFKKRFGPAFAMVLVSMLMMVYTRHHVRLVHLADEFDPASTAIRPEWSVFIVFLICFAIAMATIGYMLKLFFRSPRPTG